MRIFILEDDETRQSLFYEAAEKTHYVTLATDYDDAIKKYHPPYDWLFLDHDLGGKVLVSPREHNTGAAFVRWLPSCDDDAAPNVVVHSYNPTGAAEMVRLLREKHYNVIYQPFGNIVLNILRA